MREVQWNEMLSVLWFPDEIDRVSRITYGELQNAYLLRDHPVIVTDSHMVWPLLHQDISKDFVSAINNAIASQTTSERTADDYKSPEEFSDYFENRDASEDFIEYLNDLPQLRDSIPCNVATNLLQIRNKSPNLRQLLRQTALLNSPWFLHFRNCEFGAVKASRGVFPLSNRPYFLSSHFPPFHSSWFLLSKQFEMASEKQLPVNDLVLVFQLSGHLSGTLTPQNCNEICAHLKFELNEGETLLFNAQMWNFYYRNTINSQTNLTIIFIEEIHNCP